MLPVRVAGSAVQNWTEEGTFPREYFYHLGAYDEGMDIWGGENLEMSFRQADVMNCDIILYQDLDVWRTAPYLHLQPCGSCLQVGVLVVVQILVEVKALVIVILVVVL